MVSGARKRLGVEAKCSVVFSGLFGSRASSRTCSQRRARDFHASEAWPPKGLLSQASLRAAFRGYCPYRLSQWQKDRRECGPQRCLPRRTPHDSKGLLGLRGRKQARYVGEAAQRALTCGTRANGLSTIEASDPRYGEPEDEQVWKPNTVGRSQ